MVLFELGLFAVPDVNELLVIAPAGSAETEVEVVVFGGTVVDACGIPWGSLFIALESLTAITAPGTQLLPVCGNNEAGAGEGRGTFFILCRAFASNIGRSGCKLTARSRRCRSVNDDSVARYVLVWWEE